MRIGLLTSEMIPFAKTGGLADVAGALPKSLRRLEADARAFMPLYGSLLGKQEEWTLKKAVESVSMVWKGSETSFAVWESQAGGFPAYFIENKAYYERDSLYGSSEGDYPDNGERFGFFARASLEAMKALGFKPDILHGHDWQSATVFAFLRFIYQDDPFFHNIRSLFTIHNLAYQGLFPKEILETVGLPDWLFQMDHLEFYGKVNYLKSGILYSNAVNTVSPRYSQEIQTPEFGHGLDGLLRKRQDSLHGILNGVDYSDWDPAGDPHIARTYSAEDLSGKSECKKDLLKSIGLDPDAADVPVIGMVSRLAGQKGLDILLQSLDALFKKDVRLVILGLGEKPIQDQLSSARQKYPSFLGLSLAFNEDLAHKVYAGSDLFLIPSRYEPCGLTQMYSLKYGTIPVVRATGGLEDTIEVYQPATKKGNGFKFKAYSSRALLGAVKKALGVYTRRGDWLPLLQNAMACDFSWERSARRYLDLYRSLL